VVGHHGVPLQIYPAAEAVRSVLGQKGSIAGRNELGPLNGVISPFEGLVSALAALNAVSESSGCTRESGDNPGLFLP
jgi:hypothetical protein